MSTNEMQSLAAALTKKSELQVLICAKENNTLDSETETETRED